MDAGSLLTWEALATYAGAAAATWLIANVIRYVTGYDARWLGLAVALVLQALVWFFTSDQSINAAVLAVLNAFVVYVADTGGAAILAVATAGPSIKSGREFTARWW